MPLKNHIDPCSIQVNDLFNAADGAVIVKCYGDESFKAVEDVINVNLGNELDAKIPEPRKPRIKVISVYNENYNDVNELCSKIKRQNSALFNENDYVKILKIENSKKRENFINIITYKE